MSDNVVSSSAAGYMPFDELINLLLRGGTVSMMVLLSALLLLRWHRSPAATLAALFAAGVAAFAVHSWLILGAAPSWWRAPLAALESANAIVLWLFARALFRDMPKLHVWHLVIWMLLAVLGVINSLSLVSAQPWGFMAGLIQTLAAAGFAALAITEALYTWRTDLVESRRQLRSALILAIAIYTLLLMATVLLSDLSPATVLAGLANAVGLAILSLLITSRLLIVRGEELFPTPNIKATAKPGPVGAPIAPMAIVDGALVERLLQLMTHQQIYKEHALSIASLAAKLGLTEHQARRLINQGLGYRNFNAFVNSYRLQHVRLALRDPGKAHLPILTLALDAGFQSIGPFNRAFKGELGITPTAYRSAAQEQQPTH